MFTNSYFPARYFAPRYFAPLGGDAAYHIPYATAYAIAYRIDYAPTDSSRHKT
jgi:hypothetical protein